ncbi:MAG: hypothetical protein ACJ0BK_01475 [Coraliomargaritaceae bacterium]
MKIRLLLIFPLFACQLLLGQTIIYVDKDASEGGDGTSWPSAYKFLNDALSDAGIGLGEHHIWIAEGTYYTDEGNLYVNDDQNSKFVIPSTVTAVTGGFVGTEGSADAADPARYLTTLSGLVFEEYGATGIGSSYLLETEAGASSLLIKGFTVSNSSDQSGCLINITNATDRLQTTFEKCNFLDNESTQTLIVTSDDDTVLFRNCRFERCQTSGGNLIQYGNFESCYFNQNNSQKEMLYRPGTVDRCFISDNTTTSNNGFSLILEPNNVFNSLLYRNVADYRIINANNQQLQLLHSTFIDNYNYSSSSEISSSVTVGNCLFFRSSMNRSSILDTATVGYKSTVNLPVQSAFFGIFDYYSSNSNGSNISGIYVELYNLQNQSPYAGTSVFESGFFKKFEAEIPSHTQNVYPSPEQSNGQSGGEFLISKQSMHGRTLDAYNDSYAPELTPIVLPDLVIPDPFVNSSDPLGPDGQPFTEDDGLRLDPNSQWASEVINVTTITADYELYDILGNPRIVGGSVDLGAYEYAPIQDADGDGISDANDDFPNNPSETLDTDDDGLGDNQDSDDDGDGVDDAVEIASGTDPKHYNSALYNFVQSLGSGAYNAEDIAESRSAGQSDVTSEPSLFNLYTEAQVSSANAVGRTQGQKDVTTDPNSFNLYSAEDYNLAQTNSRSLGQQDVITSPLSYGLYSPSYVVSLLDSSRTAGQNDVTGNPSSYGLYSEQGITDLRPGSTILQLGPNNSATLELQIERSNDLSNWTADTDDLVEVEIPLNGDTEFFRFKMTE